jgi:cytochrome P450
MERLRSAGWLARAEPVGWFVLDREAATFFLRTPAAKFPGTAILEFQGITEGPLYERLRGNLLDLDGENHRRLRKLVQPAFTPPAADRLRPAMRRHLSDLWEALEDTASFDAATAICQPYPARMIAELMGAPISDAPRLGEWANKIQGQFDPVRVARERPTLEQATQEFQDYASELLRSRRGDPGDDLISELLAAEEEGDRLTEAECVDLISAVLVGGVDTTQAQLAHGLALFSRHPEQWEAIADAPELAAAAAEEVLRFEPITPFTARLTREEITYRGVTFPAGSLILASAVTANRDPDAYGEPGAFDIHADRGRAKPLTFGAGPHFCLGASLARAELQEAFAFLAPRMRGMRLASEPAYESPLGIYGIGELRLEIPRGS